MALDLLQGELVFSFRKSRSGNFNEAVSIASSLPGYSCEGEGNDEFHVVRGDVPVSDPRAWKGLQRLRELINSWKSSQITFDGETLREFPQLNQRVTQIQHCFRDFARGGGGSDYCRGKTAPDDDPESFACRFESGVSLHVARWGSTDPCWYQFGALSNELEEFTIDKPAILERLRAANKASLYTYCPHFDDSLMEAAVGDLPSVVSLGEQSSFKVKYSETGDQRALGIEPKDTYWGGGVGYSLGFSHPGDDEESGEGEVEERYIPNVHYANIAGQDDALEAVKSVIELPLRHPDYFEELGVEPQKGVLLYGPPGNGKTLIAKAVACESNAHLEIISGPEIVSKWIGQSQENLRTIFERAERLQPSIVLIDEIDSIAPVRSEALHHHDTSVVSQLLVLLDGMEERGRVAVLGTTNRPEGVDPAIRRPGRFDYVIEVPLPNAAGRSAILNVHLAVLKTEPDLGILEELVGQTAGFSGAELASLCREAGVQAIRKAISAGVPPSDVCVQEQDLRAALESVGQKRTADDIDM